MARIRSAGGRFATWIALLFLIAALGMLIGRVPLALDALGSAELHIGVLAGLAALLFGWLRLRLACALAAAAAILALGGADVLWRPVAKQAPPGPSRTITFATANVYRENDQLDALRATLEGLDADILVTVETPPALMADPGRLGELFPYRFSSMREDGASGSARDGQTIWSRMPLESVRRGPHPSHAIASIDLGLSRPLQVMALHFDWPVLGGQDNQARDFDRFWKDIRSPNVVAGDFNAAPWSTTVRRVEMITRTHVLGGYRATWFPGAESMPQGPWNRLGLQLDQILISAGIGVDSVRVVALPGSDHQAVVARLVVTAAPMPDQAPPADPLPARDQPEPPGPEGDSDDGAAAAPGAATDAAPAEPAQAPPETSAERSEVAPAAAAPEGAPGGDPAPAPAGGSATSPPRPTAPGSPTSD